MSDARNTWQEYVEMSMKGWAEVDQGDVVTKRDEKKYDSKISWNHESMCFGWFRAFVNG